MPVFIRALHPLFICHLFPSSADQWDFILARFDKLCFVYLLLPCPPCKQTQAPHTASCVHRAHTDHQLLWMHQKGQSIQLALQISTSYVLWQHQMSAPKWAASVQQHTRSSAWEDEPRLWNGPSEPGLWACMANAAMNPSVKAALGFCPEAEMRMRTADKMQQSHWPWGCPEHGNSLSQLWATQACFFIHQLFPTPNAVPTS